MVIRATLANAKIEIEEDGQLTTCVVVRMAKREPFEPFDESEIVTAFMAQRAAMTDDALIAELLTLSRAQRVSDPVLWSLWALMFPGKAGFLVRLHFRAGEMRSRDRHGAAIRAALAHAQAAVGFGRRGKGRSRKIVGNEAASFPHLVSRAR